jgi:hypothetical protein
VTFSEAEGQIYNWLTYYKTVDNDGKKVSDPASKYGKFVAGRKTGSHEAKKVIVECMRDYQYFKAYNDKQQKQQEQKE